MAPYTKKALPGKKKSADPNSMLSDVIDVADWQSAHVP